MKHLFTIRNQGYTVAVFEQDVKVTTTQTRDIPLKVGDRVRVLADATVEEVYGDSQREVTLSLPKPVKIVSVQRA